MATIECPIEHIDLAKDEIDLSMKQILGVKNEIESSCYSDYFCELLFNKLQDVYNNCQSAYLLLVSAQKLIKTHEAD
jgi:hypothetical protein